MSHSHIKKRIMFIPVSSPEGIGEYTRCLILANRLIEKYNVHFVINEHAPYASECPYETTLLSCSPTKDINSVNESISNFMPDLVVFDASGRHQQMQHAKQLGAKVVFLSQHKRKRNRGMKLQRARFTDLHLVVQPSYLLPAIPWWRKKLLNYFRHAYPLYVGAIFDKPIKEKQEHLLASLNLVADEYLVFSAGSGSHRLDGELVIQKLWLQAKQFVEKYNKKCVVVFGSNYPHQLPESSTDLIVLRQLPPHSFVGLLSTAHAAVLSGGDTLVQAIAMDIPTVSVAVSKDQPRRIAICSERGLTLAATSTSLTYQIDRLMQPYEQHKLKQTMAKESQLLGLDKVLQEINHLLNE